MATPTPQLTSAGYALGAVSALAIFFSAVPIVAWGAADNVLSKFASILVTFMVGPVVFTVGAIILRLFGVAVFKKRNDVND